MKFRALLSLLALCSWTTSATTTDLDTVATQYVRLVLGLGQHDSGYVDAYYGPAALRQEAESAQLSAAQIASAAQTLRQSLPEDVQGSGEMTALRVHYLRRQLDSLVAHANALVSGKRAEFDVQSRALYDTEAPHHALADFDPALKRLALLLPGDGSLTERVDAFRDQFYIPKDKLSQVFDRAIAECRNRTKQFIPLLANENFVLEYVTDKPWSGYNWYQGDAQSLIQVNVELPIEISRAVDLGCHEGYPGHHTYNALLEKNLVNDRGWLEFSVYPLYSPQSLIAEGSANYGIELAFPGDEKMRFERDVLFPLAGLNPALAQKYEQFNQIKAELSYASNEIARQYLSGQIDKDQAVALLQTYSLYPKDKATQRVRFFDTYGAYVINYNWGKDLIKQYVEQSDDQQQRWQRFATLLSSPRVPSSLSW